MSRYKYAILLLFVPIATSCARKEEQYGVQNNNTIAIIEGVENAFKEAEDEIFLVNPIPDDKPLGPDPDPEKCACRGTGKIKHGDGHETTCPFHPIELIMNKYKTGD